MLLLLLLLLLGVSGYVQKRKTELGFYKQDNACQSDSESSISAGAASPPREPEEGPVPAAERNDEGGLLDDTVATSVQVSEARAAGEKQRGERAAATVKLWHSCKQADAVAAAVQGYAARYRQPKERTDRVAIEIAVDRVLCGAMLKGDA